MGTLLSAVTGDQECRLWCEGRRLGAGIDGDGVRAVGGSAGISSTRARRSS